MTEGSDEELLAAIGVDPGALPAFYLRHIAKVTGMGVRRFDQPEDVADFVANVFLEVLRSAGGFDPGRGHAVAWLYGLGSNVAAAMYRQQALARSGQSGSCRAARSWTRMITPGWRNASTRRRTSAVPTPRCNACRTRIARCSSW